MTIIENAYNKFTEEKKQQTYQKKFKSRIKPMPKLRYASAVNLTNFLNPDDLNETQPTQSAGLSTNTSKQDKTVIGTKEEEKRKQEMQAQDPNCYIVNPDKIDTQSIQKKPTRSESLSSNQLGVLEDFGTGKESRIYRDLIK